MGDLFKIKRKNCGKGNKPPSSKNYQGRMILQSAIYSLSYRIDMIRFRALPKKFQFP